MVEKTRNMTLEEQFLMVIFGKSKMSKNSPVLSPEQVKEKIDKVFEVLSLRERQVIELRYGLSGTPPNSLKEVALIMAITEGKVRYTEQWAIKKLKITSQRKELEKALKGAFGG